MAFAGVLGDADMKAALDGCSGELHCLLLFVYTANHTVIFILILRLFIAIVIEKAVEMWIAVQDSSESVNLMV